MKDTGLRGKVVVVTGAAAGIGIDYHFRTPAASLRPFFTIGASFGLSTVGSSGARALIGVCGLIAAAGRPPCARIARISPSTFRPLTSIVMVFIFHLNSAG